MTSRFRGDPGVDAIFCYCLTMGRGESQQSMMSASPRATQRTQTNDLPGVVVSPSPRDRFDIAQVMHSLSAEQLAWAVEQAKECLYETVDYDGQLIDQDEVAGLDDYTTLKAYAGTWGYKNLRVDCLDAAILDCPVVSVPS